MSQRLKILPCSALVNTRETKNWNVPKGGSPVRLMIQIWVSGISSVHPATQNMIQRFTAVRCLWHVIPVSPLLSFPCTCAWQLFDNPIPLLLRDAVVWIHFAQSEVDCAIEFIVTSLPPVIAISYLTVTSKFALPWRIDCAGKASLYSCGLRKQILSAALYKLFTINDNKLRMRSETEISSFHLVHLSKFHLKTETESSVWNVVLLNERQDDGHCPELW
jgi:hypothetical protein